MGLSQSSWRGLVAGLFVLWALLPGPHWPKPFDGTYREGIRRNTFSEPVPGYVLTGGHKVFRVSDATGAQAALDAASKATHYYSSPLANGWGFPVYDALVLFDKGAYVFERGLVTAGPVNIDFGHAVMSASRPFAILTVFGSPVQIANGTFVSGAAAIVVRDRVSWSIP